MNSHTVESTAILTDPVAVLRHAYGLNHPYDFHQASVDRQSASAAFAADFFRALDDEPGIGAWWPLQSA